MAGKMEKTALGRLNFHSIPSEISILSILNLESNRTCYFWTRTQSDRRMNWILTWYWKYLAGRISDSPFSLSFLFWWDSYVTIYRIKEGNREMSCENCRFLDKSRSYQHTKKGSQKKLKEDWKNWQSSIYLPIPALTYYLKTLIGFYDCSHGSDC